MEPYLFYGKIRPERAQLSLGFDLRFQHSSTGHTGRIEVSVILNELVARVYTDEVWDIFDLRNLVSNVIRTELSAFGYLVGRAYDIEITRVLRLEEKLDHVFGIEVDCIAVPRRESPVEQKLLALRPFLQGESGIYVSRCLMDLMSALRYADDTAFYCYRAVEALRNHCVKTQGKAISGRDAQWELFRSISGVSRDEIALLSDSAKGVRHGGFAAFDGSGRALLLEKAWEIVDRYLAAIQKSA